MNRDEKLADWEVELLTPTTDEGDLVEATKGEEIVRGRVRKSSTGTHSFIGASARTTHGLVSEGFTVVVVEKAKPALPPLPTEYGLYTAYPEDIVGYVHYENTRNGWFEISWGGRSVTPFTVERLTTALHGRPLSRLGAVS